MTAWVLVFRWSTQSAVCKSLKEADFLINLFRPGGHGSYVEGFTLGFKNHYGTYDTDHSASSAPGYLRDINCTGAVYNKNVLSVCYGIFGAAENSGKPDSSDVPYFNYAKSIDSTITNTNHPPCTIIMSTDPITAEMQTIKMMCQRENPPKSFDVNSMPKYQSFRWNQWRTESHLQYRYYR